MAITVCGSCVEFGSCPLCDTPTGFNFNGVIKAKSGFRVLPTHAQGEDRGYVSGGSPSPLGPNGDCAITRFQFASGYSSAAVVGCLAIGRKGGGGATSSTHGYIAGGRAIHTASSGGTYNCAIDKFQMSDSSNATTIGDLSFGQCDNAGAMSTTTGYVAGGRHPDIDTIEKYPFSSDTNASDSGDLICDFAKLRGHSSRTHAYFSGGTPAQISTTIQKFPFASEGNAADVGELSRDHVEHSCQNSAEAGYAAGGLLGNQSTLCDNIDKFPFSSDSPGTDIGNLSAGRCAQTGVSSTTDGYSISGSPPSGGTPVVDSFPFASDTNATNLGVTACFQVAFGHGHQC